MPEKLYVIACASWHKKILMAHQNCKHALHILAMSSLYVPTGLQMHRHAINEHTVACHDGFTYQLIKADGCMEHQQSSLESEKKLSPCLNCSMVCSPSSSRNFSCCTSDSTHWAHYQ